MTSFVYDIIDPCDLIWFPTKYGSILLVKMYPPMTHPINIVNVETERRVHIRNRNQLAKEYRDGEVDIMIAVANRPNP